MMDSQVKRFIEQNVISVYKGTVDLKTIVDENGDLQPGCLSPSEPVSNAKLMCYMDVDQDDEVLLELDMDDEDVMIYAECAVDKIRNGIDELSAKRECALDVMEINE